MRTRRSLILGGAALALTPVAGVARAQVVGNAASFGFDARLLAATAAEFNTSGSNFHGFLVERHGQLVVEAYRKGKDQPLGDLTAHVTDFNADTLHDVRDISRSVVSLLWGMAAADGKVPKVDTPVLGLYPKLSKLATGGREAITIRHLLTMTAGLKWNEIGNYGKLNNDAFGLTLHADQVEYVFNRPMDAKPGTAFTYSGGCTAVLADLLTDRVGMSLSDYAKVRLFGPMGIDSFEWRKDIRGHEQAFAGLRLKPRDLVHIGRMVNWSGQWQGLALVPADWLAQSLQPQIATGQPQIAPQYGYHWWTGTGTALGRPLRWQAAVGNGGLRLFLIPDLDLVVVVLGGDYSSFNADAQHLFEHVVGSIRA